jgi:transcriptional regulator with XRE-family HTH domain
MEAAMAERKRRAPQGKARRKKEKPTESPQERADRMVAMREEGYTFEAIAEEFSVSRQRVYQIVSGSKESPPPKKEKGNNHEPRAELLRGRGIDEKIRQYKAARHDAESADVGDRIVFARMRRGMTIGQLAQESGLPYGVLSTYENNKAEPSCESLRKLCGALNVSAHWVIFGRQFKRAEA